MDFKIKKENGYKKMRLDPKYMDLQPSQTWLRKWILINGFCICLNSMEDNDIIFDKTSFPNSSTRGITVGISVLHNLFENVP